MTDRTRLSEMKIQEATFNSGFLTFASLSALLLAVLLAVVLQSLGVFLVILCVCFVPLIGALYPPVVLALFLFSNLLVPKLPLIPIQGYMVPIRIEDVFLACALACLLLRRLIFKEKPAPNLLRGWMAVFCVVTGFSLLFGLFILGSVPGAKIGFLYWLRAPEYFAASYLCAMGVTSWKQYRQMVVALITFVVLIGVYGILQEFSLVPIFDAMHISGEIVVVRFFEAFGEERLFSTFAGPYDLAAFYLVVIPICVALLAVVASRTVKLLLWMVLALSTVCFYLTYARSPLVAMPVVLFTCLMLLGKRRLGIVFSLGCIFPAFILSGFRERLTYAMDDPLAKYALGGRIESSWGDAIAAVSRSPILGTGPASLFEGMGVDCLYILLLGVWGILGLVSFAILIFKAIEYQRELIRTSENKLQRALAIGVLSGTVGLLINGLTVDSFLISKVAFSYWFLMGLLFAGSALEKRVPAKSASFFEKARIEGVGGRALGGLPSPSPEGA